MKPALPLPIFHKVSHRFPHLCRYWVQRAGETADTGLWKLPRYGVCLQKNLEQKSKKIMCTQPAAIIHHTLLNTYAAIENDERQREGECPVSLPHGGSPPPLLKQEGVGFK